MRHDQGLYSTVVNIFHAILTHHPWLNLLAIFLMTFALLLSFPESRFSNEIENILDDPAEIGKYRKILEHFGAAQTLALVYKAGGLDKESLVRLRTLVLQIEAIPGVRKVNSLMDRILYRMSEDMFREYLSVSRIERLKKAAEESRLLIGNYLSADHRNFHVLISIDEGNAESRSALVDALKTCLKGHFPDGRYSLAGYPVFEKRYFQLTRENTVTLLNISVLICVIVSCILFRNAIILLLLCTSILFPPFLTFYIYLMNGNPINMLSSLILPLILVISLNMAIYIISFFKRQLISRSTFDLREVLHSTLKPCMIASFTTFLGFYSIVFMEGKDLVLFAKYSSLSILFSFGSVFVIIFSGLRIFGSTASKGLKRPFKPYFSVLARFIFKRSRFILLFAFIFSLAGMLLMTQFVKRNSVHDIFNQDDPYIKDVDLISKSMGGIYEFDLVIENETLLKVTSLRKIRDMLKQLRRISGIGSTLSIIDFIEEFCATVSPEPDGFPVSDRQADNILNYYRDRDIAARFINRYADMVRIGIRCRSSDYFELLRIRQEVLNTTAGFLGPDYLVTSSGRFLVSALIQQKMMENSMKSIFFALCTIMVVIFFFFRSFYLETGALLANTLPIIMAYGTAAAAGLPLNMNTMIVATVILGLIVDDSIHLLHCFQGALRQGHSSGISLYRTIRTIGSPILLTSIILMLGVSVFMFGSFQPIVNFGVISNLIIFYALIFDLLFLPSFLHVMLVIPETLKHQAAKLL